MRCSVEPGNTLGRGEGEMKTDKITVGEESGDTSMEIRVND